MRKQKCVTVGVLAALYALLQVGVLLAFHGVFRIVMWIVFTLLLAGILVGLHVGYKWLMGEAPRSYFQYLDQRNIDGIVLGSTKVWQSMDTLDETLYRCFFYRKSLFMDFCYLKTYYSHVKPGGKVYLFVDYKENCKLRDFISVMDRRCVHGHIFLQLTSDNIIPPKTKRVRVQDLWHIFSYFVHVLCKKSWRGWRVVGREDESKLDSEELKYVTDLLEEMIVFCRNRNLVPEVLLIDSDAMSNAANRKIASQLSKKYEEVKFCNVKNGEEIKGIFSYWRK